MSTEVVANALEVCDCQMVQDSVGHPQFESHTSAQAWEFNSAYDDVVGAFLFGLIANGPGAKASMLRFTLGGTAPYVGEAHLGFPPDCLPRTSHDGRFYVQVAASGQGRERVCQELVSEWEALPQFWSEGRRARCARWAQDCPVRESAGGVRGRRFLAMNPEPPSWDLLESATKGRRDANLARMKDVDARGSAWDSLPQRAKKPSAGGDVAAYSPSDGRPRGLSVMWSPSTAAELRAGPMVPGNVEGQRYGQIL